MKTLLVLGLVLIPSLVSAQETTRQKWLLHTGAVFSIVMDVLDTKSTFDAYDACGDEIREHAMLLAPHLKNRNAFRAVKYSGAAAINGLGWKVHDESPKATAAVFYGNGGVKLGAALHNWAVARDCRRRGVRPSGRSLGVKLIQIAW